MFFILWCFFSTSVVLENAKFYSFIRIYILNIYIEVFVHIIIHNDFIIRLYLLIYIYRFII